MTENLARPGVSVVTPTYRRRREVTAKPDDSFFVDYGVLEDAHLSLRAGRRWRLLQCGDATCEELHASGGRPDQRTIGYRQVVNFHYVFRSVAGPLSPGQQFRFWRYQLFECGRMLASGVRRRRRSDFSNVLGRIEGMIAVARGVTRRAGTCAS